MNYTGCYIELTSRCNLSCKHCLHTKEGEDYHLSLESVKKAITYFIRNGLKCVYLSGGEPLLYNQFSDICDYLTLQERIEWELVTNATLVTDSLCDFLKKANNLRRINISLDGASAQIHDFNRGVGVYDKVIKSIILLKNHGFNNINIQMVIAKYNKHEVDDFQSLAAKYDVSYKFLMLSKIGESKRNADNLYIDDADDFNVRKIVYKDKGKVNYSCPLLKPDYNSTAYVDYLGNVYLCRKLREAHREIGNIYTQIIDDNKISMLLEDIANYSSEKTDCSNCSIKLYCKKGCFAEALMNSSPNDGLCTQRILSFTDKILHHTGRQ
ncbi:MAG: radical SAM protein [Lachnospiraceae bacterium]|nr:radical SAM protein [uncultured Acetatifactor sp.]MCI8791086.1 radical SAM protein [Lachnospiraceae bacterium]